MDGQLVQIYAPHFTAGLVTDGHVIVAAPIIRYMGGWDDNRFRSYCLNKGWTYLFLDLCQE